MTPDAAELDSVDHVAIQVSDIERAVDWYRTRFNTQVLYRDASWALLRFANVRLALVTPAQHPPHIALYSDAAERFGALVRHRDGTRSVYIEDSEGNAVEIMSHS
jgi:catechol 2,3-dioxygenase-like lactoylglutathione lyase family enzyme